MPPDPACLPLIAALALLAPPPAGPPGRTDADADGDGLSDFQERHKYRTDPARADTDGDGTPDGEAGERREHTYTVRARLRLRPPYNLDVLSDDYQDARVLDETDDYAEVEVVLYPLCTAGEAVGADPDWREAARKDRSMRPYLKAGPTTNWDRGMQRSLRAELSDAGIDADALDDRELVTRVSAWLMERNQPFANFGGFSVGFRRGKPFVFPELLDDFERDKPDPDWSREDMFEHGIYGKGMFENRSRGSCTPSGNLMATVLRALGIPTRIVVCVPVVDGSDPANLALLVGLTHHRVRETARETIASLGKSFSAHTFNEVRVGGRWVRLNYNRLGQGILDRQYLGLMVHVHTYNDLADSGMGEGWGRDHPWRKPSETFRHSNPYTCVALDDLFGEHAAVENPEVEVGGGGFFTTLTLERLYWFDDPSRPAMIGADWHGARAAGAGHLLAHIREASDRGSEPYSRFYERVPHELALEADGKPSLRVEVHHAFWADGRDVREVYLRVLPEDLARMERGVAYSLTAPGAAGAAWKVADGVSITRR